MDICTSVTIGAEFGENDGLYVLRMCSFRSSIYEPILNFQVVRRPHVFLFRDEKDPVERNVINLANSQVIYDPEAEGPLANTFT